jgi:hypothetical protein
VRFIRFAGEKLPVLAGMMLIGSSISLLWALCRFPVLTPYGAWELAGDIIAVIICLIVGIIVTVKWWDR